MPGHGLTHGPPATRKAGGSHHRFSRINRHSLRDGLRLIRALPGETGLCCRRPCDAGSVVTFATMRKRIARGTCIGAPGPHDFAVRAGHVRLACRHVHRIPAPRIATIGRNVPLHRGGMRGRIVLICPTPQGLIVWQIGTTGGSCMACTRTLPVGQVSIRAHRGGGADPPGSRKAVHAGRSGKCLACPEGVP